MNKDRLNLKSTFTKKKTTHRACIVAYTFYESDFRVIRYAETLAKNGWFVEVIALRELGLDFHEIINNVHVYRIQRRIVNEKGKFTYLFRILRFLMISAFFITRRYVKQRYNLIHVHNVPDFLVFGAIIPKLFGAKIILDIHDILPEFYTSKFSKGQKGIMFKFILLVEKLSIKFSDYVIISNHLWKDKIESRSPCSGKCTAIINYPDKDIFFPRKPATRGHDEIIMLYPGTVNWHQGLDIAVQAFARIIDLAPKLYFHIYGSGTHLDQLKDLIDQLGLNKRVRLLSGKPIEEIAEIMANANFGVIPKRNDQFGGEAFSTKSLEFMLSGIPVIVSRTIIDQYYYNDTLVKFFEPENVDDLARVMLEMFQDEGLRNRLSKSGHKFASKNTWNEKQEKYLTLVNELCQ